MKNARALQVLARILSGAMWLNLHYLPPNRSVLEVRVKEVRSTLVWLLPMAKIPQTIPAPLMSPPPIFAPLQGYGARWEVAGLDAPVDMCSTARASPAPTAPASAAASEGGAAADVFVSEVHAYVAAVDDAASALLPAGTAPRLAEGDGASAAASAAAEATAAATATVTAPPSPPAETPAAPPAAAAAIADGALPAGPPQPRWWGDLDGGQVVLEESILVKFRGFLEPQVADGHALGWRH